MERKLLEVGHLKLDILADILRDGLRFQKPENRGNNRIEKLPSLDFYDRQRNEEEHYQGRYGSWNSD